MTNKPLDKITIASYLLATAALLLIITKGLLAALFSGLLVYSLVHLLTPVLGKKISDHRAKVIAVAALSGLIVTVLSIAIFHGINFFKSDAGNMETLLQRMADIIESSRTQIPMWLRDHLPEGTEALRTMLTQWLREHAVEAKTIGSEAGRTLAHILIGMVIGAMIALRDSTAPASTRPMAVALRERCHRLADAFRQMVFAQFRIAAINAVLTGVFLAVVLPLAGVKLPLVKSMIAITFFAGLLPVIGNLISNTVVVVVGLSHSLHTAIASLVFLVVIHKLEYFLNARIIGSHINARSWELLTAILVMESIFGLPGVVAAPVFYAYLKRELSDQQLV